MGTASPVNRQTLDAFNRAYAARDLATLSQVIDDNATWSISGPVDLLEFCGTRHGKAAVLDMVGRLVPGLFTITGFVQDSVVLDGDRAATLSRLSGRRSDGRAISYRVAQFIRFCGGKVTDYCSVIDSFDAAEQVLGHRIELDGVGNSDAGDLIAI
jgi:ketosteroid isomerase-like protein